MRNSYGLTTICDSVGNWKTKVVVAIFLLITASAVAEQSPELKKLYDGHRWPELREAIKQTKARSLYMGAVASAFNEKNAEKLLQHAIKEAPNSEDADEARGLLAYLYIRVGRMRDAVRQFDAMLKFKPGRSDVENARTIFAAFARHPDMSLGNNRQTTLKAKVSDEEIVLPVGVHGQTVHWMLDTGANLSVMAESEARMLGVAVEKSSAQFSDLAGGNVNVRTAVVDELAIGDVRLRNVPFLILSDNQPPMNELPVGERALLGFQVAFALQSFAWQSDGTFRIGFKSRSEIHEKNLFFDSLNPVTRAQYKSNNLDFVLDTGNGAGTQLWTRFAEEFATTLREDGTPHDVEVRQFGGANEKRATEIPVLQLRVGGLETTLRPALVFRKPVGNDFQHGLLGMDVLSRSGETRIDFRSMTVQLLP